MARIVLAGGSGFLGGLLTPALLAAGHEVVILARRPHRRLDAARELQWDGKILGAWAAALEGAHAVINLAGKNVNCRYTPRARHEILRSRLDSVDALAAAIQKCTSPPKVFVQCASAAIYGNAGEEPLEESVAPHPPQDEDPFSPDVCRAWEAAVQGASLPQTRKIILRIGFVLHAGGGALRTLARITHCFMGGRAGPGTQFMSWLHHEDFTRILLDIVAAPERFQGVYLAVSPSPTRNGDFMRALRHALHRPWSPPAPIWAIRLACLLMRTEPELALRSRRCIPRRLLVEQGFAFRHGSIVPALKSCFAR